MVSTNRLPGVSLDELRAAVALARLHTTGDGLAWSSAAWERVWERLTAPQQHIMYLHIIVGLNHTQTAEQLGMTRSAVDAAFKRAIERVRDAVPSRN